VRGEIALRPHNRYGAELDGLTELTAIKDGIARLYRITSLRPVADGYLVQLEGVSGRDAAAALTLSDVRVRRADLPPLEPGEYYVEDVTGCAVTRAADGKPLGVVQETFWNGAHDVATVVGDDGAERLIPLVPAAVVSVDAPGRKMVVDWDGDSDDNG
jgi:16S rRNA processing protein RimM